MENLSRRSFLALGTLGAASAAAAGLAGCAPQTKGSASTDLATTGNRSSEPINSSGIEVNPDEVVEVIETNIVHCRRRSFRTCCRRAGRRER